MLFCSQARRSRTVQNYLIGGSYISAGVRFDQRCRICDKDRQAWANRVDPDQTPQHAASDLDIHCLLTRPAFLDQTVLSNQCRHRSDAAEAYVLWQTGLGSDAAEYQIWSGSSLFATYQQIVKWTISKFYRKGMSQVLRQTCQSNIRPISISAIPSLY